MTISVLFNQLCLINYNKIYRGPTFSSIVYEDHCFFQFVIYVEIYVKMNCIILNSFPIMCYKGAPVLATFLCLNGSLLDQSSCIIFTCSTCTYSKIYVYISVCLSVCLSVSMSVCLSVHLREVGGLIWHSSPYIL